MGVLIILRNRRDNTREISPKLDNVSDQVSIRSLIGQKPKQLSSGKQKVYDTNMGTSSLNLSAKIVYADLRQMLNTLVNNNFDTAQDALNLETFLEDGQ